MFANHWVTFFERLSDFVAFFRLFTLLTLFSSMVVAGNNYDINNMQKMLVNNDVNQMQFVLENYTVSQKQLNPVITPLIVTAHSGNKDAVSLLIQNSTNIALKDSASRTTADYALNANQNAITELFHKKSPPSEDKSSKSIGQAIQQALALAAGHSASNDARLERFTGTIIGNAYRNWDFSLRDNDSIYRVRFDGGNKTEVFKRPEKQDAVREYWSKVKPAKTIADLDELVIVAQQKIIEAGFSPTGYIYIKYSVAGPHTPITAHQETLEVSFEIAGDEKARCVIFHDRQFQRLSPAKIIKIHVPEAPKIPQPEIPTAEIPEIKIPEISDQNIRVQENDQLVMLTLQSDILFDFDKWNIRRDAKEALEQILGVLTSRYAELPFEIHGHTDSMGTEAYNINLSQHRANSVKEWLVNHGIQEKRIGIYTHGELQPIAPNNSADGTDNPKGREKNRRVEILIHKQSNLTKQ